MLNKDESTHTPQKDTSPSTLSFKATGAENTPTETDFSLAQIASAKRLSLF